MPPEEIKHNAKEFGGRQYYTLPAAEVEQRLCVVKGCGNHAWTQSAIMNDEEPETLRFFVVCKEHVLAMMMSVLYAIGHPDANGYGARIAEQLGVDWHLYLHRFVELCAPEAWRCAYCNGQMAAETVGMFKGQRWVHTCGITVREATKLHIQNLEKLEWTGAGPEKIAADAAAIVQSAHGLTGDAEPVRTAYCGAGCSESHTYGLDCAHIKNGED